MYKWAHARGRRAQLRKASDTAMSVHYRRAVHNSPAVTVQFNSIQFNNRMPRNTGRLHKHMATANTALAKNSKFIRLGNEQLQSLQLDADVTQLTIEVVNASRFVVSRRAISKPEEVRGITEARCLQFSTLLFKGFATLHGYYFLPLNYALFACIY